MPRPWTGLQLCIYGQARSLSTFEEYSQEMILSYITSQLETVSRVDIVWDKYLTNSLKQSIIERIVALRRDNACLRSAYSGEQRVEVDGRQSKT